MDQEVATFSLQYSCLENFMDGRAWNSVTLLQASVLSSVSLLSSISLYVCTIFVHPFLSWYLGCFHFHALEKEMATHASVLAWRIPGTGEPGGLPSMGSHRGVGHDWSDLAAAACGEVMNKVAIFTCRYLCEQRVLVHLGKYLGMKLVVIWQMFV